MEKENLKNRFWKVFSLSFFPPTILTGCVVFLLLHTQSNHLVEKIKIHDTTSLKTIEKIVSVEFQSIAAELVALTRHNALQEYLTSKSEDSIRDTLHDWGALLESRTIYDQIRFIDSSGLEKIRINNINGVAQTVPGAELQNKSNRYYFKETYQLDRGDLFVSPLDLNVEKDQIERPLKPMIRFGTPVFDRDLKKRGVVIINYLASHLLGHISADTHSSITGDLMLVNSDGFYLMHPDSAKEWGFMFGNAEQFDLDFPAVWKRLVAGQNAVVENGNDLFIYRKILPTGFAAPPQTSIIIAPDNKPARHAWFLISYIPGEKITGALASIQTGFIILAQVLLLIYFAGAWFLAKAYYWHMHDHALIQEKERTINLLLNSTAEGIYGVDLSGRIVFVNRAAQNMLGYEQDEALGKVSHDLFSPRTVDGMQLETETCNLHKVITNKQSYCVDEGVFWKKNGEWLPVEYRIQRIEDAGQTLGAVVSLIDVTEKKLMLEKRIRTAQMASLGELATGVAHEINNPINGVINYAQILKNEAGGNPQYIRFLDGILKEGGRIAKIVRSLLNLSRQEDKDFRPVSIAGIIQTPIDLLEAQLKVDGITLDIFIEENLPEISGNSQQLEQVLINLISNSRHALNEKYPNDDPDKILHIVAGRAGNRPEEKVQLTIMDRGIGIPEEKIGKVFNSFYTTKSAGIGTGLGLSISQDILNQHDAHIHIESVFGDYTKAIIQFPV